MTETRAPYIVNAARDLPTDDLGEYPGDDVINWLALGWQVAASASADPLMAALVALQKGDATLTATYDEIRSQMHDCVTDFIRDAVELDEYERKGT